MQDYELTALEVSDFKDNYGNSWCDVAFLGVSEPVKWVLKDPNTIEVGKKYYGEILEVISKAGKSYLKFKRGKKDEEPGTTEFDDKQSHIKAQWAIGQAVILAISVSSGNLPGIDAIERYAKDFYSMVDRVKSGSQVKQVSVPTPDSSKATNETKLLPATARPWDKVGKKEDRDEDRDIAQGLNDPLPSDEDYQG